MAKVNKVNPIVFKDKKTGEVKYTLDFDRDTASFANRMGFDFDKMASDTVTMTPILFYAAFRKHHKNLSRQQTDEILYNELHGLSAELWGRLMDLYNQTRIAFVQDEDEFEKNAEWDVEM